MQQFDTLIEAIDALRKEGYTEDFNLKENCLECGDFAIFHDEFQVDKYFRFDGATNPDDESVLYAIAAKKHGIKGLLVNAYGMYSDPIADEIMAKLK
jgi:hypothetical protein